MATKNAGLGLSETEYEQQRLTRAAGRVRRSGPTASRGSRRRPRCGTRPAMPSPRRSIRPNRSSGSGCTSASPTTWSMFAALATASRAATFAKIIPDTTGPKSAGKADFAQIQALAPASRMPTAAPHIKSNTTAKRLRLPGQGLSRLYHPARVRVDPIMCPLFTAGNINGSPGWGTAFWPAHAGDAPQFSLG